jgi:hypothetical protein
MRFATLGAGAGSAILVGREVFMMNDKIDTLLNAFWALHPVLETGIAIAMFRRGQHRAFKYFFAYIVTQILVFAVVFPTFLHSPTVSFYVSSFCTAVSVVLGFMVIHEAFLDIFRPFHTLKDLGTVLFKWAGLVMLLVAGVVSVSNTSSHTTPWVQAIMTAERCVRIIQVGMVLFLLLFARYLGVSRRQQSFGICLGFGIFATVELGLNVSWVGYHIGGVAVDSINLAAYNCTLLVWLCYALRNSPERDAMTTLLRPQRWEHGLSDIRNPLPADSLIPMFEDMVDRALSRTPVSPISAEQSNGSARRPATVPVSDSGLSALSAKAGSKPTG